MSLRSSNNRPVSKLPRTLETESLPKATLRTKNLGKGTYSAALYQCRNATKDTEYCSLSQLQCPYKKSPLHSVQLNRTAEETVALTHNSFPNERGLQLQKLSLTKARAQCTTMPCCPLFIIFFIGTYQQQQQ